MKKNLLFIALFIFFGCFSTITVSGQDNTLEFDGNNDVVNVPDDNSLDFASTASFTLEAWINPDNVTGEKCIIDKWDGGANLNYRLSLNTNRLLFFTGSATNSTGTISANTWTHVAVTYDNSSVALYINGSPDVTATNSTGPVNTGTLTIGNQQDLARDFDGEIEEVRIWNDALSSSNISHLYNKKITNPTNLNACIIAYYKMDETSGTTLPDETGNGNTGTVTDAVWISSTNSLTSQSYANCSAALPVELTNFKGQAMTERTFLTWQTATEANNEGFEIERSADRQNWKNIGFVKGSGTAYETQNYQFTDTRPYAGINYYRLKQTDFDGGFEYSDVVSVDFSDHKNLGDLKVIPNPVQSGEVTLSFSNPDFEEGTLEIYNTVGQLVRTELLTSYGTRIQVNDLPKGMYLFSVNLDGLKRTEKVIIE